MVGESRTGLATQIPRTSGGGTPRVVRAGNRREKIKIRW